jgi:hypothetical protein
MKITTVSADTAAVAAAIGLYGKLAEAAKSLGGETFVSSISGEAEIEIGSKNVYIKTHFRFPLEKLRPEASAEPYKPGGAFKLPAITEQEANT